MFPIQSSCLSIYLYLCLDLLRCIIILHWNTLRRIRIRQLNRRIWIEFKCRIFVWIWSNCRRNLPRLVHLLRLAHFTWPVPVEASLSSFLLFTVLIVHLLLYCQSFTFLLLVDRRWIKIANRDYLLPLGHHDQVALTHGTLLEIKKPLLDASFVEYVLAVGNLENVFSRAKILQTQSTLALFYHIRKFFEFFGSEVVVLIFNVTLRRQAHPLSSTVFIILVSVLIVVRPWHPISLPLNDFEVVTYDGLVIFELIFANIIIKLPIPFASTPQITPQNSIIICEQKAD